MKRNLFIPIALTVLFISLNSTAWASSTSPASSTSISTSTASTTTSTSTSVKAADNTTPTTAPSALSAVAQTRITNLCANLSNRMDGTVARLQNIINRLNSRLKKMADGGQDITSAQTVVTDAQTKLNLAKGNLKNIDSAVAGFVGSNNPNDSWRDLKFTYLGTRDAIIASHTLIMQAIQKALTATTKSDLAPVATSTASTTSSTTKK